MPAKHFLNQNDQQLNDNTSYLKIKINSTNKP